MPVKPDEKSKHLQLVMSDGEKFHQTLTVIIKNSNVLVQPTDSSQLHITLHPNQGNERCKNSHFRIEKSEVKNYKVDTENKVKKVKKGMLVEWNRKINKPFECPLELRFPSYLAENEQARIIPDYKTYPINCGKGCLHLNFWFTSSTEIELLKYFQNQVVELLIFEKIESTNENFALTFNISESDESYKNIEKSNDYFEIDISQKNIESLEKTKKVKFTFGQSSEHKKLIIFH